MQKNIKTNSLITLNAYIAKSGICSRRKAVDIIKSGAIKVNNQIITESSYRVQTTDLICYKDTALEEQKKVYILLNKPKGYICTVNDEKDRRTVLDLVSGFTSERLYPVGRLDRATTGLLILTNDGQLSQKLAHPKFNVPKIYRVNLDRPVKFSDLKKIVEGIVLEDGPIQASSAEYAAKDGKQIDIQINSGRNRIIRRIFEHLGYKVMKLDRTKYAFLIKKQLPQGYARLLEHKEVSELLNLKY